MEAYPPPFVRIELADYSALFKLPSSARTRRTRVSNVQRHIFILSQGAEQGHLFERAQVDSILGLDNRAGIFAIHRSVRIALLTATAGPPTDRIDGILAGVLHNPGDPA